jgi:glutamyl-tRNA reductase
MCDEELDRYVSVSSAREVAPLVARLHEQSESVRRSELERFRARLGDLDERQLDALDALTHGIVAKLLHQPTIRLKDAAGTPKGERLAEALRDLFEL